MLDPAAINKDDLIQMRRFLHENPGVSRQEREASELVMAQLQAHDVPFTRVGPYGVLGIMEGGSPGPSIFLRADMDALPITESQVNLSQKKTAVSKKEGAAHLCGHDAHTAILLGVMKVLAPLREKLKGTILLAFEQDEETGSGVKPMIEALKAYNPSAGWGLHVNSFIETGTISLLSGPSLAGGIYLEVEVYGESGHGSTPHLAKDALLCAANMVTALSSVTARDIAPDASAVLSIGTFQSGDAFNAIADKAHFAGSCRYFDEEVGKQMDVSIRRIVESVSSMFGCSYSFIGLVHRKPTFNDPLVTDLARKAVSGAGIRLVEGRPLTASETFAYYEELCPTTFAFLGTGKADKGTLNAPFHNPVFDIDEDALEVGVRGTCAVALELLEHYAGDRLNQPDQV